MKSYVKFNGTSTGDCINRQTEAAVKTCGCDGAGCANCSGTGYIRPRFFAGQLLTEEDLQSLSDYVVAKNRLHNRHFFGEGVICGLDVTCHPCGGGKVTVAPGYALDCCGNDIVLNCPIELDINAMVREFRINTLGGYDCGDPCAEKKMENCEDEKKDDKEGDQKPVRRYCLYIRYCEELSDPVTPYGTDEPCVNPACEPTRVQEGVRFELRCPEKETAPDDLFMRIRHCFGDLTGASTTAVEAGWHQTYGRQIAIAKKHILASPTPAKPEPSELTTATSKLNTALDQFTPDQGESLLSKSKTGEQIKLGITPLIALQDILEATLDVTSLVARFVLSRDEEGQQTGLERIEVSGDLAAAELRKAISAFSKAFKVITKERIEGILPTTLERAYANALFEVGKQLISGLAPHGSNGVAFERGIARPDSADWMVFRYLAERVPVNSYLFNKAIFSLNALREWLLCRLEKSTCSTDCTLREDVLCISFSDRGCNTLSGDASIYSSAAVKLLETLFSYLRECLCCALNPPCPPCDDSAVLLACMEVKDCKVMKICNLERNFVLTPVALRYWLPPLHLLGEVIEKICCCPIKLGGGPRRIKNLPRTYSSSETLFRSVPANLLTGLFGLRNTEDAQRLVVVLGALWSLIRAEGEMDTPIKRELLTLAKHGMDAIVPALSRGRSPDLASLFGVETLSQGEKEKRHDQEIELLKQRCSDLEARLAKPKGRTP